MHEINTFPDGQVLFAHCNFFGFEGVVSKRVAARYDQGVLVQGKVFRIEWLRTNLVSASLIRGATYR